MDKKCVIFLDQDLPLGLLANASAVLALSLGKMVVEMISADMEDASGAKHVGISNTVLPILKTQKENLTTIREKAYSMRNILVVDFSDVAQLTKTYEDYSNQLKATSAQDLLYLGIALCGDKQAISSLTGKLPSLK